MPRRAAPTGYVPVMTDEHLSTPEVPASLIPAEDDEGPQTAEASRACSSSSAGEYSSHERK